MTELITFLNNHLGDILSILSVILGAIFTCTKISEYYSFRDIKKLNTIKNETKSKSLQKYVKYKKEQYLYGRLAKTHNYPVAYKLIDLQNKFNNPLYERDLSFYAFHLNINDRGNLYLKKPSLLKSITHLFNALKFFSFLCAIILAVVFIYNFSSQLYLQSFYAIFSALFFVFFGFMLLMETPNTSIKNFKKELNKYNLLTNNIEIFNTVSKNR